ncbi:hypothetical protein RHSIM_Rhsim04G0131500 [Rhododendron simsii]|uniref:Uncharacterized protein n=1 Tax=Rhododendron simsii TaxID=118357 RepID=A0A834LM17_RHOSS|nr:hypothetical protein RHSIM_Rhsim04G0131500 [Rhododendron simsii]
MQMDAFEERNAQTASNLKCQSRYDIITPQVHVADINQALAFYGQGTNLEGRARAAQVLLSCRESYDGFIDRRTRAADNPELLAASSSNLLKEKVVDLVLLRSPTRPYSYSRRSFYFYIKWLHRFPSIKKRHGSSKPANQPEPLDPTWLCQGPRRYSWPRCSPKQLPSHGRRAVIQTDAPPGFSHEEVEASH